MSNVTYEVFESDLNPCPAWNEGTEAQEEFADTLVEKFCDSFSRTLNWALKSEIIDEIDADSIVNSIFLAIDGIDDARWWCDKKAMNEFEIALKLLDDKDDKALIKKIEKQYNS